MSRPREREQIPAPMKREVRQRCGFGCVVCGTPIFEYHHMTPWSEVLTHEAENLTLLCDLHHKEATGARPLLSDAQVRRANVAPFNRRRSVSRPHMLHFEGPDCVVVMGSNTVISPNVRDFVAVAIDGHPLLGFRLEDGIYLLQFRYFTPDNRLALLIQDNEISFDSNLWDVHWSANRLVIREKLREIILDIEFFAPNEVEIHRGRLHWNGVKIEIAEGYLNSGNQQWLLGSTAYGAVGIHAGHDPQHILPGAAFHAGTPVRLPGFEYAEATACPKCGSSQTAPEGQ